MNPVLRSHKLLNLLIPMCFLGISPPGVTHRPVSWTCWLLRTLVVPRSPPPFKCQHMAPPLTYIPGSTPEHYRCCGDIKNPLGWQPFNGHNHVSNEKNIESDKKNPKHPRLQIIACPHTVTAITNAYVHHRKDRMTRLDTLACSQCLRLYLDRSTG